LKNCQKECDRLKNDIGSLETKSKWSQHKLKQEMDLKTAAEAKVEELTNDLKHVRDTEMAKLREEFNVDKMLGLERQCVEYQATQILLKHDIEAKDKKIEQLDQTIAALQTQYNELKSYHHNLIVENSSNKRELDQRNDEMAEVQTILDKEVLKIAALQSKLHDLETLRTQFALEREANSQLTKEMAELRENCGDQEVELGKLRDKETELLQFNKELTERCVHLQSECTLLHAKVTAVQLENEAVRKDKQYYDDIIGDLERRLAQEVAEKTEERVIAAKHIAEKTKLCDSLQKQVENGVSDLEAIKKKHSQTVKVGLGNRFLLFLEFT
jgi:chromosome segregation ATPase